MANYLFIASHVDDLELCCGSTIAKLISQSHQVTCISLSHVYDGVDLQDEFKASMETLNPIMFKCYEFETRLFNKSRQKILDLLVDFSKLQYDFVFTHSPNCFHQDHTVVGQESLRAFKNCNLITYQGEWNTRRKKENYFVSVEKHHVEKKIESLSCYKSQEQRPYMHHDYIWANSLNTGVKCGTKYAESFEVINMIQ